MKTLVNLLLLSLFLCSCNNISFNNQDPSSPNPAAPTTPIEAPLTGSYLETWQNSLPDEFKNLTSGQFNHQIGMNNSGDAVIAWEIHGTTKSFYLSHLKNSVWTHPQLAQPFNTNPDNYFYTNIRKILVSESGDAKVIYSEGTNLKLYEYKNGVWVAPIIIGSAMTSSSIVATSPNGKILIISVFGDKLASVYFNGSTWVDHGEVKFQNNKSISSANVKYLSVAVDNSGKGYMSFSHDRGSSNYGVFRIPFDGSSWLMPADDLTPLGASFNNRIAMNATGKVVSMWQTFDDVVHFQENSGSGWGAEYTFNPGFWVSVERMEILVSSAGEMLAVWPESNLLKFYKKSGSTVSIIHSIPDTFSKFSLKAIPNDKLAITWNTANEVKYVRCDFSTCASTVTVSALERDQTNSPMLKIIKNFDVTNDRISIFWQQEGNANGYYVIETSGAEESTEWLLQLLSPIVFESVT